MEEAKANPLQLPDKATWLAAREKTARPHRKTAPTASPTPPPALLPGDESSNQPSSVVAVAGTGLIAQAARTPVLLPLAFAVQALASGADAAVIQKHECQLAAAIAVPLERLLLTSGRSAQPAALQALNAAIEALAVLQARCSDPSANASLDFEPAKAALVASVTGLGVITSPEGRAAASDLARALQGLPLAEAPEAAKEKPPTATDANATTTPDSDAGAAAAVLEESRVHAEAAREQRDLIEMQNKVLWGRIKEQRLTCHAASSAPPADATRV